MQSSMMVGKIGVATLSPTIFLLVGPIMQVFLGHLASGIESTSAHLLFESRFSSSYDSS